MKDENKRTNEIKAFFEALKSEDKTTLKALSDYFKEKANACDGNAEDNLVQYYESVCGACFLAGYADKK